MNNLLWRQRQKINDLDSKIFALLEKRFLVVQEVAVIKKNHDLPVVNNAREAELLQMVK